MEKIVVCGKYQDAFAGGADKAIVVSGDRAELVSSSLFTSDADVIKINNAVILPGFADVHVHLREPGFSYKETIKTGSMAAARGGFTTVLPMPNLNPVPNSLQNLRIQTDIISRNAAVEVLPYGAITAAEMGKELSDMEEMSPYVSAFSDDGRGVQSEALMLSAMHKAKSLNKIIAAHCEVNELLHGGYIHAGSYAQRNSHAGISSESEWRQVKRDIALSKKTGCSYHVCHISCKESVSLIREAKAMGINVSCETAPHYLLLDDSMLKDEGRFKMNPPLRSPDDRQALIDGLLDGTIDMIATDHAPHSAEEKSRGLKGSAFGITGLETAFPLLFTHLVMPGIISLEKLVWLMAISPRIRFGLSLRPSDFTVFNTNEKYEISPDEFLSMGKSTPFEGMEVYGKCIMTVYDGKVVYRA
ncbi:MAG: dihydroorotase [Ruminococcaceae bacterium]|nr:dihydroorotase [Oscillospiraceae bacterium]